MATDWRHLPAGPELDRLVAERVMGWTECAPNIKWSNPYGLPPGRGRTDGPLPVPRYSTDDADSAQLVRELKHQGAMVAIVLGAHENHDCVTVFEDPVAAPFSVAEAVYKLSYFRWHPLNDSQIAHQAGGPPGAVPLYVCRAALAWAEAKEVARG